MQYPTDPAAVREAIDALRMQVEWLRQELSGAALDPWIAQLPLDMVRGLTPTQRRFLAALWGSHVVPVDRLRFLTGRHDDCDDGLVRVHLFKMNRRLERLGAPTASAQTCGYRLTALTHAAREWLAERLNTAGAHHDHSRSHAGSAGADATHQPTTSRA